VIINFDSDGFFSLFQSKFIEGLRQYRKVNNDLPDRVIVFRDGVGDGRLEYTKSTEIPQLESAFRVFGDDYNPKLTVVIVSKRINEKFMHYNSRVRTTMLY